MSGTLPAILIASRNAHKVSEIKTILGDRFRWLSLNDFPSAPAVVEDAPRFAGNATKKAVELARWLGARPTSLPSLHVLADDSGLEVDALNGAPGVHSARFAALDKTANSSGRANLEKLLSLMKGIPPDRRTARFRCVVALTPVFPSAERRSSPVCDADEYELATHTADGTCEGTILFEPRGRGGFGYDPLFVPTGFDKTFAELGEDVKNRLSHRAKALQALKPALALLLS